MLSIFKPAAHAKRLPDAQVDPTYRRLRWQISWGFLRLRCLLSGA